MSVFENRTVSVPRRKYQEQLKSMGQEQLQKVLEDASGAYNTASGILDELVSFIGEVRYAQGVRESKMEALARTETVKVPPPPSLWAGNRSVRFRQGFLVFPPAAKYAKNVLIVLRGDEEYDPRNQTINPWTEYLIRAVCRLINPGCVYITQGANELSAIVMGKIAEQEGKPYMLIQPTESRTMRATYDSIRREIVARVDLLGESDLFVLELAGTKCYSRTWSKKRCPYVSMEDNEITDFISVNPV